MRVGQTWHVTGVKFDAIITVLTALGEDRFGENWLVLDHDHNAVTTFQRSVWVHMTKLT